MPRKKSSPAAAMLDYVRTADVNAVAVVLDLANAAYAARTDRVVPAEVTPKKKRKPRAVSEIPAVLPPQGSPK